MALTVNELNNKAKWLQNFLSSDHSLALEFINLFEIIQTLEILEGNKTSIRVRADKLGELLTTIAYEQDLLGIDQEEIDVYFTKDFKLTYKIDYKTQVTRTFEGMKLKGENHG